jgi:hypothetical protein
VRTPEGSSALDATGGSSAARRHAAAGSQLRVILSLKILYVLIRSVSLFAQTGEL